MTHDTHSEPTAVRPTQIDHVCGHRFTHLFPAFEGEDTSLLGVLEALALHPCPACMAGEPDWAVGAHPARSAGSEAGAC